MSDFSHLYTDSYFEDRFSGKDENREKSYAQEIDKIKRYLPGGTVLDVGCGMGNFLIAMGDKWDKYGIEISEFASKKAAENGIKIIDYQEKSSFFDLIVLRGVLQHLDTPLYTLKQLLDMLRPGGYLVFLATPNTNSIYYKCFNTLPMLDPERNFLLPSDTMLKQILLNYGLEIEAVHYPYLESPYSNVFRDHLKFIMKCMGFNYSFPFWKSMMEVYARKEK